MIETRAPVAAISDEIRDFCEQEGILHDLQAALARAREHFPLAQPPSFELVRDPDSDARWLSIVLPIRRAVPRNELLDRHDAFLDAWVLETPANREKLRVAFRRV